MSIGDPITILLIEDDPGHARLIEKNLKREKIADKLVVLGNGKEAIDYFFGQGKYSDMQPADRLLVLLDLNLPVIDGFEVLRRLKTDPRTKGIPVIVLTSTDDKRDVARCYDLGCNVFMTKPVNYEKFCETIRNLATILTAMSLPKTG